MTANSHTLLRGFSHVEQLGSADVIAPRTGFCHCALTKFPPTINVTSRIHRPSPYLNGHSSTTTALCKDSMIPDTCRNRLITRGCIGFVSLIAPLSVCFAAYTLLSGGLGGYRLWLFLYSLMESVFCAWWIYKYKYGETVFERVIPSLEERRKLKEDCLRIIRGSSDHGKEFIEGWYRIGKEKASLTDLREENIKEWLCWAYFASSPEEIYSDESLRGEMEGILDELYSNIGELFPNGKVPTGRNTTVKCIRLTLDPIRSEHRPLIFYLVVSLLQHGASFLFRLHGYRYRYYSNNGFGYWHRSPPVKSSEWQVPPLVIIHGIGSVLSLLWFVTALATRSPNRHIFVLDIQNISMRLPRPNNFPTAEQSTRLISAMLHRHLPSSQIPKAIFLSHSLGSATIVWLLKYAPEIIAGIVLVDPISLLLQYVDVAHNFIYRSPQSAAEIFFEWIAREPGIAMMLSRNFHWFSNVFPMIIHADDNGEKEVRFFPGELESRVFLSERDCIVPTRLISEFLGREGGLVQVMSGLDHGGFLFDGYWLDVVLRSFIEMEPKGVGPQGIIASS